MTIDMKRKTWHKPDITVDISTIIPSSKFLFEVPYLKSLQE